MPNNHINLNLRPLDLLTLSVILPMAAVGGWYSGDLASNFDPKAMVVIGGAICLTLYDLIKLRRPTRAMVFSMVFLGATTARVLLDNKATTSLQKF